MYGLTLLAALFVARLKMIWRTLVSLSEVLQPDAHRLPEHKEDNKLDTQKFHRNAMVLESLVNSDVSLY